MSMFGAIIGDIVGSRFEFDNHKSKEFEFFHPGCYFTDDSVMTIAIGAALLECKGNYENLSEVTVSMMRKIGRKYPHCGYGGHFRLWLKSAIPRPYNSYGNGAPMRVSACGIVGNSLEEVKMLSKKVTEITHNHPEGLKAAEAIATCVYLARTGSSKQDLLNYVQTNYYPMDLTLDEIREEYEFDVSSQGSTPQALKAFFESVDFEDAIRNAISIGGDSDTIGAMTGAVAGAFYGIPKAFTDKAKHYLESEFIKIIQSIENTFSTSISVN